MKLRETLILIYAGVLTVAFGALVLLGARRPKDASFDQITVQRINVVEPDGTTRMVLSDKARFPGWFYLGKEYPRADRQATGILFNDDEGTENGGLIFGGGRDKDGVTHSYGHLSFDNYQRDQTMVLDSENDGSDREVFFGLNDDDRPQPFTPAVVAEYEQARSMPEGPARTAALAAWRSAHPGGLVQRVHLARENDKSVALVLKDPEGHPRLTARVTKDGEPVIEMLDAAGKVTRRIDSNAR